MGDRLTPPRGPPRPPRPPWPTQPGPQTAAWVMAGTAYVVGAALLALRGAHPDR
ncbi:hypothetical protein [Streptomyces sp. NPDC088755]|uniref:hypothetical protein n=1 Tax=Streptomyces sp. NPDC088755 TaxID=3365888 RepID=UPI00382C1ED6